MFHWEGCPSILFDLYMEVGDVTARAPENEDTVYIEVWVGSSFSKNHIRSQCRDIRRRPVYGIMKQILKLCGNKKAGLIFMADDENQWNIDAESWSGSIFPLLSELQKLDKLHCSILYTRKSFDFILQKKQGQFRRERDKAEYNGLFEMLDILVTGQANPYAPAESRTVHARADSSQDGLDWLPESQNV